MTGSHRRGHAVVTFSIAALLAAIAMGAFAPASFAAVTPAVTLGNDANQDGVFSSMEDVAKTATYPVTVTFKVTIDTGTFSAHRITSLTDTQSADLSGCSSLLNTLQAANSTLTCAYTLNVGAPQATPVSDSVTITWDKNLQGGDTASSTSIVNTPSMSVNTPAMTVSKSSTTQVVGAVTKKHKKVTRHKRHKKRKVKAKSRIRAPSFTG